MCVKSAMMEDVSNSVENVKKQHSRLSVIGALSAWMSGLFVANAWLVVNVLLLFLKPITGTVLFMVYLMLVICPLEVRPPVLARKFLHFSLEAARDYFPVTIHYEDRDALQQKRPFIVGYEPHSVLPLGICTFCQYAAEEPPLGLVNSRILVSTAGFFAPIIRHLWWWLGCRPASRHAASTLLEKQRTIVLCPGGVQECLYMSRDKEVLFLRKRYGFVRLGLEYGAPLVPVFAFGQTRVYSWMRLPFASKIARKIGWVPMLIWGYKWTVMPRQIPMHIVVGKPIELPKVDKESITTEMVEDYLNKFINEMEDLYHRYSRKYVGCPAEVLEIY